MKTSSSDLRPQAHIPDISIGLPVYNGEWSIRKALDSLLAQTFTDFELIISDNASTDRTGEICQEYAAQDARICYVRQPENRGAGFNFGYALQEAQAKYFMWAAADDFWEPSFIEENYRVLVRDRNLVASISKVRMASLSDKSAKLAGTYPIRGAYSDRLRQFLSGTAVANSRFYALFRRDALLDAHVGEFFIGSDWATIVNSLKYGNFHEVDRFLMERSCEGASSQLLISQMRKLNVSGLKMIFPLFDFTKWLWMNISRSDFLKCIDLLVRLNLWYTMIILAEIISIRRTKTTV